MNQIIMKILTGLLAATVAVGGISPVSAESKADSHWRLIHSIEKMGVKVLINDSSVCSEPDTDGMYSWYENKAPYGPTLTVCQDNGKPGGPEVGWTANDLDTLRHEAHHLLQDCIDGNVDFALVRIWDDKGIPNLVEDSGMSSHKFKWIVSSYGEDFGHEHVMKEVEAFAVADLDRADLQADMLQKYCMY